MAESYSTVTELPGNKITREQLERLFQRYRFAKQFCQDKIVLELACGGGTGLGYLANAAKKVVGGDIDEDILKYPLEPYKGREKIELMAFDAQNIPFSDKSFDVVILYEAIYYLKSPEKFVKEAHRLLNDKGILLICTANKDWAGFNPSPFSTEYFSAPELYSLAKDKFAKVELFGGFQDPRKGAKNKIISSVKKMAVRLNLIPKTMKGKEIFKRILFGKLITLPSEIEEGQVKYNPPVPISSDNPDYQHKVIFLVAYI